LEPSLYFAEVHTLSVGVVLSLVEPDPSDGGVLEAVVGLAG
jgi:hypothetical protein